MTLLEMFELKSRNTDDEKYNYLKERRKNEKYFNTTVAFPYYANCTRALSFLINFVIFTYQNNL